MPDVVTFFAGFGGATIGAMAAGFTSVLSVEWNGNERIGKPDAIAAIYADNLGDKHLRCEPVQCVPESILRQLHGVDLFTASAPCTNASVANKSGGETDLDRELATATARAIRLLMPRSVIIENVWQYTGFDSYRILTDALDTLGYGWRAEHLNAADFGVPQTRKRLYLRAGRSGKRPDAMRPTHAEFPEKKTLSLFDTPLLPWNGWYGAIAELLDDCPESDLAPWQEKRMVAKYGADWRQRFAEGSLLIGGGSAGQGLDTARSRRPAVTVKANGVKAPTKAVLVGAGGYDGGLVKATAKRPSFTITSSDNQPNQVRALLFSDHYGQPSGTEGRCVGFADTSTPAYTVRTRSTGGGDVRALLCPPNGERYPVKSEAEPSVTIASEHRAGKYRAVVDDSGVRVVSLIPRCLARFQTYPDWYRFPEKKGLACTGIGNAVAVDLFRQVAQEAANA